MNHSYCPKLILAPPRQPPADDENNDILLDTISNTLPEEVDFQFAEYERIDWHNVFVTKKIGASSYFVRKGISRKAQLAMYTQKYVQTKNPKSILKKAIPLTYVIETWSAFENTTDAGLSFSNGNIAGMTLDNMELEKQVNMTASTSSSIKTRLMNSCLKEASDAIQKAEDEYENVISLSTSLRKNKIRRPKNQTRVAPLPPIWILKPSTVNKGEGIRIVHCVEEVLDAVMDDSNIREWYECLCTFVML